MSQAATCDSQIAAESASDSLVSVRIDDLIVGRPLSHPVFDDHGILLLAASNKITSDFKRLLQQRRITSIQVNRADVGRISLTEEDVPDQSPVEALLLDSTVATQLDKVIDSGLMVFQNHGPAFKKDVVYHGRKAYDLDKHANLRDQRVATAESLDSMIKEALHGRGGNSKTVNQLAFNFLADLADDADCSLAVALEASHDPSLADHCFKTSMLATAIAIEMGMNEENCRRICVAGLVHDWGMAKVSAQIRTAPRQLSEHQFFAIKKHPIYTAEILERMPGIPSLVPLIAYQTHERPNGKGYPRGRTGERIQLLARILGAADIYIALTEEKPYRPPLAPYSAMETMVRLARSRDVDPDVVRAMLNSMCLFPIGSLVALSDGSVARVIRRNGDRYALPFIQLLQREDGSPVPAAAASIVDLTESELQIVQALPTPGRNETLLTDEILYPTRPRD